MQRFAQAFYLARTGRPGPVLIDVPKDVQQQLAVPDWDVPMAISGYMQRLPQMPSTGVCHCFLHSPLGNAPVDQHMLEQSANVPDVGITVE